MTTRKQMKKQIAVLFKDIEDEQLYLLKSIREAIVETPYRTSDLIELKTRINKAYNEQDFALRNKIKR